MITLQDIAKLTQNLHTAESPEISVENDTNAVHLGWYKDKDNDFTVLIYVNGKNEDRLGWAGLINGEKIYGSVPFQTEVPEIVKESLAKLYKPYENN